MADNLRITTPVNQNDGLNKIKPNRASDPLATIDTTRVIKKDAQGSESANKGTLGFALNKNSVFESFVQRMQQTPALSQTLQKLLAGTLTQELGQMAQGINETQNSAEALLAKLASEIQMDETQMLENILFQHQNSTSFNSDLLKVLRNMSNDEMQSPEIKDYLGRFLKSYDGYFSAQETMTGIISNLEDIIKHIPKVYSEEVQSQMQNLTSASTQSEVETNLVILKENIIPTLGKYIMMSNDMGETRQRITLLVHDVSRLNVSSEAELVERFSELMDYCKYSLNISQENLAMLKNMFSKEIQNKQKQGNPFIDSLIDVLSNKSADKLSNTGQTMLRDTITNLLLDQSAYMPFTHIFLPVNYNGTFMFTEIWVEKDGANKSKKELNQNSQRMYLSFDIQGLGSFQSAISLLDNTVECHIKYPEIMKGKENEIKENISIIFQNNGFDVKRVVTLPESFQIENEILRKIYEGGSSIDVTI